MGGSPVRTRLAGGGNRIRTIGPRVTPAFEVGLCQFIRAGGKVGVNEKHSTRTPGAFRGTDGSNPASSSRESDTNLTFGVGARSSWPSRRDARRSPDWLRAGISAPDLAAEPVGMIALCDSLAEREGLKRLALSAPGNTLPLACGPPNSPA
jgi:hypothetical protein